MANIKEIKKRMIDRSVTSTQLADAMGISVSNVYSILRGRTQLTLENAEKMQEALAISDEEFCFYFLPGRSS